MLAMALQSYAGDGAAEAYYPQHMSMLSHVGDGAIEVA
jgi:hypothetical protein